MIQIGARSLGSLYIVQRSETACTIRLKWAKFGDLVFELFLPHWGYVTKPLGDKEWVPRRTIADAHINRIGLFVAAVAKPCVGIVQCIRCRFHDELRDSAELLALRPMFFGKSTIEISSHAHASFEIHIAVPNPVAKANRFDVRFSPFIKRNVLVPGTAARVVRQSEVVSGDWESTPKAFLEQVRREVTGVLKIDDFDRFLEAFHDDLFPIEAARARCARLGQRKGAFYVDKPGLRSTAMQCRNQLRRGAAGRSNG